VLTDRFPFKIFYRIDAQAVIVYRVLHGAQDHARELE
jgi:plasmid stabilization system protein ParE